MKGRDGDIITTSALKIMQAIVEHRRPDGWTALHDLAGIGGAGSLSKKFVEFNGAYVRLTHDARIIFKFSKSLEPKCPPAKK